MKKWLLISLSALLLIVGSIFVYLNYSFKSDSVKTPLGKVLGFSDLINNLLSPTEIITFTETKNSEAIDVPISTFPTITNTLPSPTSTYKNYSYPIISPSPTIIPSQTKQDNQPKSNNMPVLIQNIQQSDNLVSINTSSNTSPTHSNSISTPVPTIDTRPFEASWEVSINGDTISGIVTANKPIKECFYRGGSYLGVSGEGKINNNICEVNVASGGEPCKQARPDCYLRYAPHKLWMKVESLNGETKEFKNY